MDKKRFPVPFIVGSPRSGTTLLRFMLDAHPEMAIPPETGFFMEGEIFSADRDRFFEEIINFSPNAPRWRDFHIAKKDFHEELLKIHPFFTADGFRAFYLFYAGRFGKKKYGDKTPLHGLQMKRIEDIFPEARFIHVVRNGRDAAVSLRKQWFSPGHDIEIQARYWKDNIRTMQEQGKQCRHYLEIRYEDLIAHTEDVLRKVCEFIEMDFHSDMLVYYERTPERLREHHGSVVVSQEDRLKQQIATTLPPSSSFIGAAAKEWTEEEKQKFDMIAGDVLREYGYVA